MFNTCFVVIPKGGYRVPHEPRETSSLVLLLLLLLLSNTLSSSLALSQRRALVCLRCQQASDLVITATFGRSSPAPHRLRAWNPPRDSFEPRTLCLAPSASERDSSVARSTTVDHRPASDNRIETIGQFSDDSSHPPAHRTLTLLCVGASDDEVAPKEGNGLEACSFPAGFIGQRCQRVRSRPRSSLADFNVFQHHLPAPPSDGVVQEAYRQLGPPPSPLPRLATARAGLLSCWLASLRSQRLGRPHFREPAVSVFPRAVERKVFLFARHQPVNGIGGQVRAPVTRSRLSDIVTSRQHLSFVGPRQPFVF